MSYDLMVFDPSAMPKDRENFMKWYHKQTKWEEPHGYNNPSVTSPQLYNWFKEMLETFPALNGPFATDDVDAEKTGDYNIGTQMIYVTFPWSYAEEAYNVTKSLAEKNSVGFFDVSADNGDIIFPK